MNRADLVPSVSPQTFRTALRQRLQRDDGLRCALVALNCYRTRHELSDYRRNVATARAYVRHARHAGFRGSVNAILDTLAQGGAR